MNQVSFGGSQLYKPGAYSVVNVRNNTPVSPGSAKVLAVIGSGTGGKPGVPLYYNNPAFASADIGGTDALVAAQLMWEHGADLICFSLTDQAAQAVYALKDTTAVTPLTLATLSGLRWNANDNNIKVTTTAPIGTAPNQTQTVTIADTTVTPNVTEVYTVACSAAGWQTFVTQVNANSKLVSAVFGQAGTAIAATISAVAMTGGSRIAGTATEIQKAVDALQTEDIQGIVTTLTDTTTQSAIFAHCNTMSNVTNRRPRRAFFGQPVGTTVTQYATAMTAFATSNRALVAAPGIYRSVAGAQTLLSSAFTAAAIAGKWASKTSPDDPVTFDFIGANGLEFKYIPTDLSTLLPAQITAVESVQNVGYRVVQALTSDKTGTSMSELSVADIVDIMNRSYNEQMEAAFIGQPPSSFSADDVKQKAVAILESFKKKKWIMDGLDANGTFQPAYRNITVTKIGLRYHTTYDISPVVPCNYVTSESNVYV